ncbi:zinc finger protein 506-like [Branchiostoma floridae]|uniref:Zinc finger protein 506-like n=1 Tax=Branchiostoma floridae TaxID=7739 RepID=A0A9J7ME50_BRAFL|nr:zinc finger protein 506-like [Branchiostoma floridae]
MAAAGNGSPTAVPQDFGDGSPPGVLRGRDESKTEDHPTKSKIGLASQPKANTGGKPYICGECGYRATYKLVMAEAGYGSPTGVPLKHGDGSPVGVSCDRDAGNCGYEQTKSTLDRHLTKHSGEKHYMCGECGYRATDKRYLTIHMKIHAGEKPYKCDQCDYSATRK